ncbi:MAG: AAA family ATPase [Polymorphobacter sp.]
MLGRTSTAPSPAADAKGTGGVALRVTIVLDPATAALLDASRLQLPDTEVRVHGGSLATFIAQGPAVRWTNVLICQINPDHPREFEEFERFVHDNAGRLPVVAAVRDLSVAVTRRVLRSDAVDVLPVPFTPDELHQAIETGRDAMSRDRTQYPTRSGRVVAFVGALGGMGTTALATQAGMIWAEKQTVCLIDLDVQFGNAALYLNLRPSLSLADLIESGDRLDIELMRSVAETHFSGLNVIASPPEIIPLDAITPEFLDKLLDLAVQAYDVVLLDLPGAWVGWSLSALQKSDAVCLVAGLSVPGVHQAKRQLELLDANGLADRTRIILNRVVVPLFGKPDLSGPETVLRRKVHFPISNDYPSISAAIDEGKLVSTIKVRSRVEKDIRAMVATLSAAVTIEVAGT